MKPVSPWWHPDRHADRRDRLLTRGRIKAAFRGWFEAEGFIEVEPQCLQVSPGNEIHLNAFSTLLRGTVADRTLFLHTSPEFAMKKLIAAGETKIFAFTPAFRNGERSRLHSPEFTMLEWYRAGVPYEQLFADCEALLKLAATTADNRYFSARDRIADALARPDQLTVAEAFQRHAGIDVLSSFSAGDGIRDVFAAQAVAAGLTPSASDTWSDIFAKVLTALVEPKLGTGSAVLLTEYPSTESALARRTVDDPRVAERFELYCCGVELANGYGELTDPIEQRQRLDWQMNERDRIYGERYPIDDDFMAALALMPPTAGCALGFDRLVMLATGANAVDDVIWTPLPPEPDRVS